MVWNGTRNPDLEMEMEKFGTESIPNSNTRTNVRFVRDNVQSTAVAEPTSQGEGDLTGVAGSGWAALE
jgi:hypothetical protein